MIKKYQTQKGGTNMKIDKVYGFTNENLAVFPKI